MNLANTYCEPPDKISGDGAAIHLAPGRTADMEGSEMYPLDVDHDDVASCTVLFNSVYL